MRKRLFKYMAIQTAATALITALVVIFVEMALFGTPLAVSVLHYFERGFFVAFCVLIVGVVLSAIL
ncbi:MAG: hypothetical protein FWC62_01650, partial [Firmicutes bacterium]|nr:hypothetical protein [Bacillota bacterium]